VVVGTDEFLPLAQLESKARGMPDLRLAITQHPIGGLKPAQVAAKADAMIEAAVMGVTVG
jgi:hypothetical protein